VTGNPQVPGVAASSSIILPFQCDLQQAAKRAGGIGTGYFRSYEVANHRSCTGFRALQVQHRGL
jgi:hypothetical protein